uniref:CHHC U11-48K-type domain-containing protein n=1 Tax=Caenorhabditis tropicalis TaxID=1561998 RepID=A0A1I7ULV2_9PELO
MEAPTSSSVSPEAPNSIRCPYNKKHLVPVDGFNAHIWKCRSERMKFYPHSLKLKRCSYNMRHFLPEEEIQFHEMFCKTQTADLRDQLTTEPIHLDVDAFLAAEKLRKRQEKEWSDSEKEEEEFEYSADEDDEEKKSVASEVEETDEEEQEEDEEQMINRLKLLELKKKKIFK